MVTKAKGQSNKLMRIITIPVRALSKARDLYVRSMTGYANKVAGSHSMAIPADGQMPRSFSASALRSTGGGGDTDDLRELIRAASARSYGHKNELDMYLKELIAQQQQHHQQLQASKRLNRSARAVGMGMIEEGEEDKEGSSRAGRRL